MLPPIALKGIRGTRLIAVPNGKNAKDKTMLMRGIMDNPQAYFLNSSELEQERVSTTERVSVVLHRLYSLCELGLRYSLAFMET
jgi:hypothetical protein